MEREKIKKCRENFSVLVPPKPRNGVRDKLRGGGRKRWAGLNPQNPLDFVQKRLESCLKGVINKITTGF